MKKIKPYLLFILLLCGIHPMVYAQNATEYNPGNPPEPENLFSLDLSMNNSSAGYTSGTGNYPAGKSVRVIAYVYSGYQFIDWREGDSIISTARDFYYIMPSRKVSLTAHFRYTPSNPGEPVYKYTLKVIAEPEGSGYFSNDNQFNLPGTQYHVYAYPYSGYVFKGWYRSDTLVSLTTPYAYTTGYANDTLHARFEYRPGNPGEPTGGTGSLYNLSLLTPASEKGKTIAFPVHLFNRNTEVYACTFELKFPVGVIVNYAAANLSGRKNGHTLTSEQLTDSTYRFAITGSDTLPVSESSGILMTIPVTIPQEWEVDRTYPVRIGNATIRTSTATVNCPVKPGGLRVLSEEGSVFASFYPDIYLNRAHFFNLSSSLAETFFWDFGDGTTSNEKSPLHSYVSGGAYTVKLRVSKGTQQDSAQFNIVITDKAHWRISGNFSLNNALTDVRNFKTAAELFELYSQSAIAGPSQIQVANGQYHELLMPSSMKDKLGVLHQKLKTTGHTLLFMATDSLHQPVIDFRETIDQQALDLLIELWNFLPVVKVKFALQGVALNTTAIRSYRSQVICSGTTSVSLDFTEINPELTYSWARIPNPVNISGYESEGTGILPAMTLVNATESPDTLRYEVNTAIEGTSFTRLLSLSIIVLPKLSGAPVIGTPAEGSEQSSTTIAFSWTAIKNATYDLYVWEEGATQPAVPGFSGITTHSFTSSGFCKYGKKYSWKVIAKGTCDSRSSTEGHFSVRTLPDLQVVNIQHPADLYPGDQVRVTVTIRNKGGKTPASSYWRDELALSRNENLEGILSLTSVAAYRNVLSDSIYNLTFSFVLPLDTVPYSRFVVRSDIHNQLLESDETNNVYVSLPIHIIQPRIESGDYQRLRNLYQQTGGVNWKKRWNINSDVIVAANWPGVNFQRGQVSEILLNSNNVSGNLPVFVFEFAKLKRLEMYDNQLTGNLSDLTDSLNTRETLADSLNYLNLGKNKLKGELSAFAARFPLLNYLNVSENYLSHLQQALPATISQLNLNYQRVQIDSMQMSAHPVFDTLPTLCRYNHSNRDFSFWPGFSILHQNNTVGYLSYSGSQYHLSWNNSTGWRIPSGTALEIMQHNGTAYGARSPFKLFFIQGDANVDQRIDLLDVQHSLNYVLRNSPTLFNYNAANTYEDDQLTVQDIVTTVEMILANDSVDEPAGSPQRIPSEAAPNQLYIDNNQLMLKAQTAVAALDISMSETRTSAFILKADALHFQWIAREIGRGKMRFILFSTDGSEFAPGIHTLGTFTGTTPTLHRVMLADRYATEIPARIVTPITATSDLSAENIRIEQQSGRLNVHLSDDGAPAQLSLINLQGIVVKQLTATEGGTYSFSLNNDLVPGAYLLQVTKLAGTGIQRHFKVLISK